MTAPEPHPQVVCGAPDARVEGRTVVHYECVRPPEHDDVGHYWARLVRKASA